MGEIRFVGTGETRGYPYLVCKKRTVGPGKTRGYPYPVCKKRIVGPGKTRGYPYPVCKKEFSCIPDKDIGVFHLCLQILSHPCYLTRGWIKITCI